TDTPKIRELARGLRLLSDESKLGAELHQALSPDVATAPDVGFVHRKLAFADVYFLANTSNHPVHTPATFRISGRDAAWWDPMTGEVAKAAGARVDLNLAPYESRVLVFAKDRLTDRPAPAATEPTPIDLTSGWQVTFEGGATPAPMNAGQSWT